MSQRRTRTQLLVTTLILTTAQLQLPGFALASGLPSLKVNRDVEYLNVTPTGNGNFTLRMGDRPISSDRFIEAVSNLDADPSLLQQVKAEQNARTALGATSLGLLALAPVFLGLFVTNYQRKPDGVFTRTWLAVSAVDLAAAAGIGIAYLVRNNSSLIGYEAAKDAAHAYNRKVDALEHQRN
ncbi:hypothetical protein J7643_05655 [bacterium]|nr:hypothetical protein [bacterium]